MIAPVGEDGLQKMLRITKDKEGKIKEEEMGNFMFVPMLQGKNHTK